MQPDEPLLHVPASKLARTELETRHHVHECDRLFSKNYKTSSQPSFEQKHSLLTLLLFPLIDYVLILRPNPLMGQLAIHPPLHSPLNPTTTIFVIPRNGATRIATKDRLPAP